MDGRTYKHWHQTGRTGFSLIELLLVMVILVVLAGIVATRFTGRSEQARQAAARTGISQIGVALDTFETDNGRYPTTEEGLKALIANPGSVQSWNGPYLKDLQDLPKDPWGQPFLYRFPGENNPGGYDLWSLGADGREGADDVANWIKQ